MNKSLPAVIIPANNERDRLRSTLTSLVSGARLHYEIIVVCNGCTDGSDDFVRTTFPQVVVANLEKASKIGAIRHAESLDPGFPRVYLDADVLISMASTISLIEAATDAGAHLVVPTWRIEEKGNDRSALVLAYYQEWRKTDFVNRQGFGSGCYVLSKTARAEFDQWPDVVSDDGFLRSVFPVDKILIVKEAWTEVNVPNTLLDLIKTKGRSKYGNQQLERLSMPLKSQIDSHRPDTWKAGFVYLMINVAAIAVAFFMRHFSGFRWLRDR